jgi:hypothetical protein
MTQAIAATPAISVTAARCFGCRNRIGLAGLVVLDCGVVCCQRCWDQRDLLTLPGREISVEVVG